MLGEKKTLEEAVALRRVLRDAKKDAPRPVSVVPPEGQAAGLSSSDAEEIDSALDNLDPEEPEVDLEERLPLGWEKKIAAVDLKWFSTAQNEFLTDEKLRWRSTASSSIYPLPTVAAWRRKIVVHTQRQRLSHSTTR